MLQCKILSRAIRSSSLEKGIADFRAYAPAATALRINRQPASASIVDGVVIYPALAAPPPDAGVPPDGGTDGGVVTIDGGSGPVDGGPGNIEDPSSVDAGPSAPQVSASGTAFPGGTGCATGGAVAGMELFVLLALAWMRRRGR